MDVKVGLSDRLPTLMGEYTPVHRTARIYNKSGSSSSVLPHWLPVGFSREAIVVVLEHPPCGEPALLSYTQSLSALHHRRSWGVTELCHGKLEL